MINVTDKVDTNFTFSNCYKNSDRNPRDLVCYLTGFCLPSNISHAQELHL